MVRGPVQRKPDEETNRSKGESRMLRFLRPIKTAAKKVSYGAAVVVGLALLPVALVAGCGPGEPGHRIERPGEKLKEKPEEKKKPKISVMKIPKHEQLYWWPGYVVREGKIVDVSLGFLEKYPPSTDPQYAFASAEEIPPQMRTEARPHLENLLDFMAFFIKPEVYNLIMEDNIFTLLAPEDEGRMAGFYSSNPWTFRLTSIEGKELACCFEGCPEFDLVGFSQNSAGVLYHEALHDVWGSYLSEEEQTQFEEKLRLYFSIAGESVQGDELVGAIWNGYRHTDPKNPAKIEGLGFISHLEGPELDEWAHEELSGRSTSDISAIQQAIRDYMQMRSTVAFARTLGFTDDQRNAWVVGEGFAYIGTNYYNGLNELYNRSGSPTSRYIPSFMQSDYAILLNGPPLESMINDAGGHFATVENFQNFIPHVESFIDWMKVRYPSLNNINP